MLLLAAKLTPFATRKDTIMPTIEVLQTIETKRQKQNMQSSSPHYRIHTALKPL
jgi:hypothetical protein